MFDTVILELIYLYGALLIPQFPAASEYSTNPPSNTNTQTTSTQPTYAFTNNQTDATPLDVATDTNHGNVTDQHDTVTALTQEPLSTGSMTTTSEIYSTNSGPEG